MKRSDRLDVVQQAAARTERERAERVGAAERHLVEMQQKLTALERYRSEYESGFASRAGGGVDVVGMRDFQTFLARLGEALAQQRELVALARGALDAERVHWREAAQRAHVVETLAERWQGEETRAATRRDQNECDELSQQMAAARGAQPMIPAAKTIATSSSTSAATPTAGAEAPATAFDAILSLETLAATTAGEVAAQIATDTVAIAPLCLEGVCLEGFDDEELEDAEDGEGVDALEFLADLLNVAAVARQVPLQDGGGELAANDDVMSGSANSSVEEPPTIGSNGTAAGEDASADKLPGQGAQPATPPAALTETGVEFVDVAQPVDEVTSLSRAAEWVSGPRHAPAAPERSGIVTHVRDPRWAEEFGTRIALMVRGGESSASLQLSPVELGPMDVSVTIRDSQASIHFGAAQAETRALIEASIPRLREMLAAQGFNLTDASVSQGFSRQARSDVPPTARSAGDAEADAPMTTRISASGLLDLYA